MTNKEIARMFNKLASLMELHEENPFKIRSYSNAYLQLRKLGEPLKDMDAASISGIKGVGKAISEKIREILDTGKLEKLEEYKKLTPIGVQEMLEIKGFGPKKIRSIWKDLEVESVGELYYACNENRLISLNGFGQKTQEDLLKKISYFLQSKDKFHYAVLEEEGNTLLENLKEQLPAASICHTGAFRRRCIVLESIEILIASDNNIDTIFDKDKLVLEEQKNNTYYAKSANQIPVKIYHCNRDNFGSKLFRSSSNRDFIEAFLKKSTAKDFTNIQTEESIFQKAGIPYLEAELREDDYWLNREERPTLIQDQDIKGILHVHTTYSDGLHELREMAEYAKSLGYEYIGITDHSKAAFYANGLKEDRVLAQMDEIDQLNIELAPFKIFKGIESDILYDGRLDYEEDILKKFDFIIASVHSNLKMDEEKATSRILAAVQNPYTSILGHPTGRLLLSREGYPLDHKTIIDACAQAGVSIELNANPYRLDLDWKWIRYALEKNILISINPDAHSKAGIHDVHYGVLAARKGGLSAQHCLNSLNLNNFTTKMLK